VSSKVVQNVTTDISKTKTVLNKTEIFKTSLFTKALEGTIKAAAITPEGLDFKPISALLHNPPILTTSVMKVM
jgi:hypothetical protein